MSEKNLEQQISLATDVILGQQHPIIPVAFPELLKPTLENALKIGIEHQPIHFGCITCPNWIVAADGTRSVQPITDQPRPQQFFGQDLPKLIKGLATLDIPTTTLIIVSDIFSKEWVADSQQAKLNTAQNIRAFGRILFPAAKILGINPNMAEVKLRAQSELIGQIPEADQIFQQMQAEVLKPSSKIGQLFLNIWTELDKSGAYVEKRQDNTGLRKIRDRAAFLTALYASDGVLFPKMIQKAFQIPEEPKNIIGMNLEMEANFANALMWGWTAFNPRPVITPTINGTDWSKT